MSSQNEVAINMINISFAQFCTSTLIGEFDGACVSLMSYLMFGASIWAANNNLFHCSLFVSNLLAKTLTSAYIF